MSQWSQGSRPTTEDIVNQQTVGASPVVNNFRGRFEKKSAPNVIEDAFSHYHRVERGLERPRSV